MLVLIVRSGAIGSSYWGSFALGLTMLYSFLLPSLPKHLHQMAVLPQTWF